jgi:lysophospholipid acyltransferase
VWDSAQMILTLKLSSVAINYSDGALPNDKMTPTTLKNHLADVPPLLPYLSELQKPAML